MTWLKFGCATLTALLFGAGLLLIPLWEAQPGDYYDFIYWYALGDLPPLLFALLTGTAWVLSVVGAATALSGRHGVDPREAEARKLWLHVLLPLFTVACLIAVVILCIYVDEYERTRLPGAFYLANAALVCAITDQALTMKGRAGSRRAAARGF